MIGRGRRYCITWQMDASSGTGGLMEFVMFNALLAYLRVFMVSSRLAALGDMHAIMQVLLVGAENISSVIEQKQGSRSKER